MCDELDRRARSGALWPSIRKVRDTTNQYIWQPGIAAGQPDTILGRPVVTDPTVAVFAANAKVAAFGDWSNYYLIRDVGSVRFERSDDYAFGNDLVTFRCIIRTDGRVIDATAESTASLGHVRTPGNRYGSALSLVGESSPPSCDAGKKMVGEERVGRSDTVHLGPPQPWAPQPRNLTSGNPAGAEPTRGPAPLLPSALTIL